MKIKALKLYYRYKQNELPKYFDSKFAESNNNHSHHARHKSIRYQLPTKTGTGRLSVRHCIPEILTITPECKTEKLDTHSLNPIQATFSTLIHGKIHGGIIMVIHCSSPQKSQQCDVGALYQHGLSLTTFARRVSSCVLFCRLLCALRGIDAISAAPRLWIWLPSSNPRKVALKIRNGCRREYTRRNSGWSGHQWWVPCRHTHYAIMTSLLR